MHQSISGLLDHLALAPAPTDARRARRRARLGHGHLMTAIVVAALTPFVGDELRGLLERAFSMVSG